MANSISLAGVQSMPLPEYRPLLLLTVVMNDQTYNWSIFMPPGRSYDEFLAEHADAIYADIAVKEALWEALDPKTRLIDDPMEMGQIEVAIAKEEIVRPDVPDYYAKRRAEYPMLGDQLDALWKGSESPDFTAMIARIQAIKDKYPKPS